ncbi:LOW QUALITY PROTEIN: hypothetical protein V2J09_003931 [Rumex salicifolius]
MKLRSSRTISAPSIHEDAATGSTDQNLESKQEPVLPESNVSPVQKLRCDEPLPVDVMENHIHSESPGDLSDDDFDASAELFDLNELPDFDDFANHAESSRKRKKQKYLNKRSDLSKNDSEAIFDSDFEEEFEDDIRPYIIKAPVVKTRKKSKGKKDKVPLMWEIWEQEDNRWVDEHMNEDTNLNQKNGSTPEMIEAPKDLILPLYQREWLAWGLKQEESVIKGGILADEMGMGKTLQAIALVLAKREITQAIGEDNLSSLPSTSKELPEIKSTLVICPVVAVTQWVSEVERFTSIGSTKVLVYHGANRGKSIEQFSAYDFVLTTYSTVESEYRRFVMPPKKKCKWCGKAYADRQMLTHEKYFCGPNAIRTERQSKQDKKQKRISSKSLKQKAESSNSKNNEIEEGVDEKGSSKKSRRKRKPSLIGLLDNIQEIPVIVDTNQGRGKSILHSAHYIKEKRSNTAKAILALESFYKWALSGTPLQNRVGELHSLIRFLRIVPYSFYLCKDCDCRTLDYSTCLAHVGQYRLHSFSCQRREASPASECSSCSHKCVRHFCWWNRNVATPIQESGNSFRGQRAMVLLKQKILKNILLRRTKKDRACDLALPPRIVSLRQDTLDVKEEDYYTSLYNESQAQFNTYVQRGTVMNNYAHIFDLLTRLRQAVDHPYLVVYSTKNCLENEATEDNNSNEQACGICHEAIEDPVVTSCAHAFCKACLIDYSSTLGEVSCPSCSKPLTVDFSSAVSNVDTKASLKGYKRSSILNRIKLDDFQTSTKIDALREEIRFMIERDGSAKGIVFSQFTSFLDLISYSLQKSGITCVQLVGSMSMSARDAAIKRFREESDCRIFLMSLKAGGVALNLTVASHVFLMDPWWNPAVERQAQDRIHRIGQYKPIRIVRFVIENTIEERILKLQEKKELVFEGTVGGSSEALGKLTEADMRFLFIT